MDGWTILFIGTTLGALYGWFRTWGKMRKYRNAWMSGDSIICDECDCNEEFCPICDRKNKV